MANKRKEIIFKVVVSDKKSGKAIQVESRDVSLIGKKIGDIIDGSIVNLPGFKLKITGGSGFEGAPMFKNIEGTVKKYVWYNYKKNRVKRLGRGNTIGPEIVQINTVIEEYGEKDFEEIYKEWRAQNPKKEE